MFSNEAQLGMAVLGAYRPALPEINSQLPAPPEGQEYIQVDVAILCMAPSGLGPYPTTARDKCYLPNLTGGFELFNQSSQSFDQAVGLSTDYVLVGYVLRDRVVFSLPVAEPTSNLILAYGSSNARVAFFEVPEVVYPLPFSVPVSDFYPNVDGQSPALPIPAGSTAQIENHVNGNDRFGITVTGVTRSDTAPDGRQAEVGEDYLVIDYEFTCNSTTRDNSACYVLCSGFEVLSLSGRSYQACTNANATREVLAGLSVTEQLAIPILETENGADLMLSYVATVTRPLMIGNTVVRYFLALP